MSYHLVVQKIIDLLTERGVIFKTFEHAPVRTSEEAMAQRPEYSLHQGAKALILKTKPSRDRKEWKSIPEPHHTTLAANSGCEAGISPRSRASYSAVEIPASRPELSRNPHERGSGMEFVMLVFPADLKFDAKKVKAILGVKEVNFATEEEVATITNGVQLGGVPPFGHIFGLDVFVDALLFGNEEIIFNAGDRSFSIAMKSEDYKSIMNPVVVDLIKRNDK